MGDLFSPWFPMQPITYDPPNHNGGILMSQMFQLTVWEPRGLPLGGIDVGRSTPFEDVHLWKDAIVVAGPLILVMPISRLHVDLDQLNKWSNTIFTLVATLQSFVFLFDCGIVIDTKYHGLRKGESWKQLTNKNILEPLNQCYIDFLQYWGTIDVRPKEHVQLVSIFSCTKVYVIKWMSCMWKDMGLGFIE